MQNEVASKQLKQRIEGVAEADEYPIMVTCMGAFVTATLCGNNAGVAHESNNSCACAPQSWVAIG
jgi:hypothetical protein